jgi:hypothetical protein
LESIDELVKVPHQRRDMHVRNARFLAVEAIVLGSRELLRGRPARGVARRARVRARVRRRNYDWQSC